MATLDQVLQWNSGNGDELQTSPEGQIYVISNGCILIQQTIWYIKILKEFPDSQDSELSAYEISSYVSRGVISLDLSNNNALFLESELNKIAEVFKKYGRENHRDFLDLKQALEIKDYGELYRSLDSTQQFFYLAHRIKGIEAFNDDVCSAIQPSLDFLKEKIKSANTLTPEFLNAEFILKLRVNYGERESDEVYQHYHDVFVADSDSELEAIHSIQEHLLEESIILYRGDSINLPKFEFTLNCSKVENLYALEKDLTSMREGFRILKTAMGL